MDTKSTILDQTKLWIDCFSPKMSQVKPKGRNAARCWSRCNRMHSLLSASVFHQHQQNHEANGDIIECGLSCEQSFGTAVLVQALQECKASKSPFDLSRRQVIWGRRCDLGIPWPHALRPGPVAVFLVVELGLEQKHDQDLLPTPKTLKKSLQNVRCLKNMNLPATSKYQILDSAPNPTAWQHASGNLTRTPQANGGLEESSMKPSDSYLGFA